MFAAVALQRIDVDWGQPRHEQLWPQLSGHPTSGKTQSEFRGLRKKIPGLTEDLFYELFVFNHKTGARHYLDLKEAATWVLTCTQGSTPSSSR